MLARLFCGEVFPPKPFVATFFLAALTFAQRFRCAAAIRPLASTDILRRLRVGPLFPAYTPAKAEITAFKPESCFSTRSRSFFNCITMPDRFAIQFPFKVSDHSRVGG